MPTFTFFPAFVADSGSRWSPCWILSSFTGTGSYPGFRLLPPIPAPAPDSGSCPGFRCLYYGFWFIRLLPGLRFLRRIPILTPDSGSYRFLLVPTLDSGSYPECWCLLTMESPDSSSIPGFWFLPRISVRPHLPRESALKKNLVCATP